MNTYPPITRPEVLLEPDILDAMRATCCVAVAAISGRDSVAAVLRAVDEYGFRTIVATAAHTGTEYGEQSALTRTVDFLRERLNGAAEVTGVLHMGDFELWRALNGRFASILRSRYGVWSPCLACHLYVHIVRVPLAWRLGNAPLISGERDSHDGLLKLSQRSATLDAEIDVMAYAGIEFLEPVRDASGERIAHIIGPNWPRDASQLECVLSGNYLDLDGEVEVDDDTHAAYLQEFFMPAGRAIVDALRSGEERFDWTALVRDVLREG